MPAPVKPGPQRTTGRQRNTLVNMASKLGYPESGAQRVPAAPRALPTPASPAFTPTPVVAPPAPIGDVSELLSLKAMQASAMTAGQLTASQTALQTALQQAQKEQTKQPKDKKGSKAVAQGRTKVEQELIRGFMAANRPDLARMVPTPEFRAWVGQESGWRPDAVSGAINQGLVNYGLFQFWAGHPWTQAYVQGGQWTATPFQQAKLVARYFPSLTPGRIRGFAADIQSGSYEGWG